MKPVRSADSPKVHALRSKTRQTSPVVGVRNVRQAAEYYRDVLGFGLDSVDGVFQPSDHEPGGVSAIVERPGALIHFQIGRGEFADRERQSLEGDVYLYVEDLNGYRLTFGQYDPAFGG